MTQMLHICQSCLATKSAKPPSDEALVDLQSKISASGLDVMVQPVDCLNVCDAPTAIALQAPGKASYVFSGIDVSADADDILATCIVHGEAEAGWITNALGCGRLRFCLVARLPAILTD